MPEDKLPVGLRHLEIEIHFRLCSEETIRAHGRKQVHEEVMDASVARVDELSHILEHVVYGLDDASLTQHYLVVNRHETLFHVRTQTGHDMYAVSPEVSEKRL